MKTYSPPPLVAVGIIAVCILGVYGLKAWYFPTDHSRLLIVSMGVLGVPVALWIYRRILHLYPTKILKLNAFICTLVLVPLFMCIGFGLGVPALALRLMGPDTQISATVILKQEGSRRCRRKIVLAEYSPAFDRLCVSVREFERLEAGQRVLLNVRKSSLGVFVFSIEPS